MKHPNQTSIKYRPNIDVKRTKNSFLSLIFSQLIQANSLLIGLSIAHLPYYTPKCLAMYEKQARSQLFEIKDECYLEITVNIYSIITFSS